MANYCNIVLYLSTTLCIAKQNLSNGVNVVSRGSPSRIRIVLLISFGITTLPRSSIRRTIPVAFIVYLSPFLVGVDAYIDPRADVGIRPYNINITNYAVSICKRQEIIPQEKKNSSAIKRGIFLCTVHILQSLFTKPHA